MGDCNLYHCPRLCKYNYASWCPTCDKESPRRRSRSESFEPCRKKGREMKSLTPKRFDRHQEECCENMDLEGRDQRYDLYRIRSNLCELPTTYIANNCQVDLSNGLTDVMEYLEKRPTNNKGVEWRDGGASGGGIMSGARPNNKAKPGGRYGRGLSCFEKSPLKQVVHITNLEPQLRGGGGGGEVAGAVERRRATYNHCCDTRYFGDFRSIDAEPRNSISYDTCTYFDKHVVDTANLQERYTKEIEQLRGKLRELKGEQQAKYEQRRRHLLDDVGYSAKELLLKTTTTAATENATSVAAAAANNDSNNQGVVSEKANVVKEVKQVKKEAVLPAKRVESLSKVNSKVTLKTRGRLAGLKVRKVRSKLMLSVPSSTDVTESDCSVSSSESEREELPEDETESVSEPSTDSSEKDGGATATDFDETAHWPLRQSLFPNVPPYISFNSYDATAPYKLPSSSKALKWKLSTITPVLVRRTLTNTGFRLVRSEFSRESNEWMGTWGKHMKAPVFRTLKDTQKLNHFPGTFQIGRKDRLWRHFQRLIARFGYKEFGFLPQTYVLPHDLKLLKQNWEFKNGSGNEMWIIKPPASARGVGIKVINKWSHLPKRMSLVVQKYISNPYLINGSKFDLRLYVLVTSYHPLKVYLYPDGLARFASAKYSDDAKDLKNQYMHLTNYSINKLSSQYTANEDANACQGHKWTISKLLEYMEKEGVDTKALWKNLQQLVIKTMLSGEASITQLCEENINNLYNCYELFGVDVLLDENLKAWLLEVNISPSLHSASPLDAHVKGPMVKSLFDMVQFHLPQRLQKTDKSLPCYEPKMYATTLTKKEKSKHAFFTQLECRDDYLHDILEDLTGDDVRQLLRYEDELTVSGSFEKLFPNAHTHKYLRFMEVRYYNRLFDAWETRYERNRAAGVKILQRLCAQKIHLKPAPPSSLDKNLSSMNLGELSLQPSKEGQSHPTLFEKSKEETVACCEEKTPLIVTNK